MLFFWLLHSSSYHRVQFYSYCPSFWCKFQHRQVPFLCWSTSSVEAVWAANKWRQSSQMMALCRSCIFRIGLLESARHACVNVLHCDNSWCVNMIFTKVHDSFQDFSWLDFSCLGSVLSENADHTTSFAMHSVCVGLAALRMPACSVRNGFPPSSKAQGPFIKPCLSFVATGVKCPENYI